MSEQWNKPKTPGESTLQWMREEYVLHSDGRIFSKRKDRFLGTRSNGCPVYDGYPRIRTMGRTFKYHHVVWFLFHGEWPSQQIDHLDDNKLNNHPANLALTTGKDNNDKRWKKWRATHQASLARAS